MDTITAVSSSDIALEEFRRYRRSRDMALRDRLTCEHLPLVYSIAHRFSAYGEPLDDLIQEGSIGLLRALDCFDPDRGVRFGTYATHLITSRIMHYMRDCGHLIRQPAWVQELNTRVTRATDQLRQQLGRDPNPLEIAQSMNLTEESVREVLAARETHRVVSLTAPAEPGEDREFLVIDREKIHQRRHQSLRLPIEDRIALEEAIHQLKHLEQKVLRLFFFGNFTLGEIAGKLSITTPRSAYLLRRSIKKIQTEFHEQTLEDARLWPHVPPPVHSAAMPRFDKHLGIHTAAYLRTRLAEEIARSTDEERNFLLLVIRITGLAAGGDSPPMRAAIGQHLARNIHASDLLAYLGEDTFGALLFDTGFDPPRLCERLEAQVAALGIPVTAHIGVATFPYDGMTPELLWRYAGARSAVTTRLQNGN